MLQRRNFMQALFGGGLLGLIGGKATANESSQQWWDEEKFSVDGAPCVRYLWPSDRFIAFHDGIDEMGRHCSTLVPTFALWQIPGDTIESMIRKVIGTWQENEETKDKPHIHLVQLKEFPDQIGIVAHRRRMQVLTQAHTSIDQELRQNPGPKRERQNICVVINTI
jgi:hypothetical protein